MTPKRILVPPLAPVLLLIGFSVFVFLSEMKAEPRYIDGYVDNAPARAAVLLVMLSPVFYVLCVLVNLGDIFIAWLLARTHWLSLILTPILLTGLLTLPLLFRKFDSPGGRADGLLMSCFVSVFMVIPIGVWRRLLSRQNVEPGAPPNGGPATSLGSSGVMEGPPSVS